jgi:hypothetical protein
MTSDCSPSTCERGRKHHVAAYDNNDIDDNDIAAYDNDDNDDNDNVMKLFVSEKDDNNNRGYNRRIR